MPSDRTQGVLAALATAHPQTVSARPPFSLLYDSPA